MDGTGMEYVWVVLETFPHPFLILTADLKVAGANGAFHRTFKVSSQETRERFLYQLGNGQWDIPVLRMLLEKILPRESAFSNYEVEHDFPGLGNKIMRLSARRFLQSGEVEPMVLLAMEDITDFKTMQSRLRVSESKYRSLFETTRDGILILDLATRRIDSVNPFLAELLGYRREELTGKELHEIGLFKDVEAGKAVFGRLRAGSQARFDHLPLRSKGGRCIDVEFICNVYPCESRQWVQCNIRDITERKRMEETLKYGAEKLRQAQKAEAIGKLAAGVAHDFNNLLTTITGFCSLCLNMAEPEGPLHDNLVEIKNAGDRAAALTRQILAYSRQQVMTPKILHLGDLVSDMLETLRKRLKAGVELIHDSDSSLELVKADQVQMEQVITHLVLNACDAIPDGGKITLETRRVELDEHYADLHPLVFPGVYSMLAVSDTGVGMDATVRAHAFDPYFTTKNVGKGSGLGLSMVHGIIAQSDGHISVYSEPGSGCTIKVYLPAVNARGERITGPANAPSAVSGNETVLLVEDEEALRKFACETLEAKGYRVLEAIDSESALAVMEGHQGPIHLLLTDMFIPGMSGPDLARRFHFTRPEGRAIFMSGYTYDAVYRHGFLEESARFIQKPFSPGVLLGAVREALDAESNDSA